MTKLVTKSSNGSYVSKYTIIRKILISNFMTFVYNSITFKIIFTFLTYIESSVSIYDVLKEVFLRRHVTTLSIDTLRIDVFSSRLPKPIKLCVQ